jgi:DNA-binding transcriptional ArsR family regulator
MPTEGSGPESNGPKGEAADTLSAGAAAGDPCPEGDGVKNLAQVMRLLCEETRLRILFTLAEGERDVTGLWAPMGLPQATVSHHLTFLRLAGLVSTRREGKHIHYRLGPGAKVAGPGMLSVDCPSYGLRMEVRQPADVPRPSSAT